MKTFKILFLLFSLSFIITSCSKDNTPPVITITEPVDGTVVTPGGTFQVKGTVTDDTELKEINIAGNKITSFTSKASHTLNLEFTVDANQTKGDVNFEITATDKDDNKSSKIIKLKVQ